jgi:hypothetical protein
MGFQETVEDLGKLFTERLQAFFMLVEMFNEGLKGKCLGQMCVDD